MASKKFSIEAVFKAIDKMSNPLKGMNKNTSKFSRALRTDFAKAQRSVTRFTKNIKRNLGNNLKKVILGIGVAAVVGLGVAAKEFVTFENTVTASSAKFGTAFQKGTAGFEQLGAAARQIGATTEFSATEAAKGLDFLALAGFNAVQSMTLLPGVVDLATASQTDLATASDIASDSLGAFGLMTKDSTQLGINFNSVMDTMAKTTTTSNTDLVTLFETVKKGGAAFTAAGQSMFSFNALAGKMANAGLKGAESGTQLRNIMLRLAKPTSEAQKLLKRLGVTTQDSNGNFKDVIDIIGDFEKGLDGMGTKQRSAALATVFGSRSVTGMNILLKEGAESLKTYRMQLENSTGAARLMAEVMRGSIGNQIETLKSSMIELGFKFIEAFQTQGLTGLKGLTTAIQNFDPAPILEGINRVISVITTLVKVITPLAPFIIGIASAFFIYNTVMKAAAIATVALNAAMNANPVSLIIIGVGLLIGVIILLVKNLDTVKEFMLGVWESMKAFGSWIATGFVKAFKIVGKSVLTYLVTPLNLVIEMFQGILKIFSKIPGMGDIATGAIDGLQGFQDKINQNTFFNNEPAPVSPQERANNNTTTSTGELTIRDETGRAEMTQNPTGSNFGIKLKPSGGL